ncbi:tetratricopeptide repeat protein [Spiractinospora alimapuensis]|uniref:tetratricopeptide repeat protein n=1 Tax=Spiractinospora alimapuensis TaxID=2820884 RepID=UPI001F3E1D64|nr:tetratricopeptide repeat protein [Spiractinospora alimapuensis]QVQ53981.1 tetratricopeptide repeat protein [Spiractinospora alimapuensis]
MSRGEAELRERLSEASAMRFGEAQQAAMEDVVRHADAGGFARLAFEARRRLADAYSVAGQWHMAFPLFSRCLSDHDQRPELFEPEDDRALRLWYTHIVHTMVEFPDITMAQLDQAMSDVERRFKAGGHNLHPVYDMRRWVAQVTCDWEEEERNHRLWWESGGPRPRSVWDFEVDVERLVRRGDETSLARAREIARPALVGDVEFDEPPTPIQCLMLLPLTKAGATSDVALARRRSAWELSERPYRIEYMAMHIEFCAMTGNEDQGLIEVRRSAHRLRDLNRPNGTMEMAAAIALLMRRLDDAGRGEELVAWSVHEDPTTPVATMRQEMTELALDLAARFDERNGTTAQGDRIRSLLAAEPVVDFLPLTPTSRAPRRTPAPRGMSPEDLLERAEWHQRAQEDTETRDYLDALPAEPPEHLVGRITELHAVLAWDADTGDGLRRAAEEHRRNDDHRRHLLCRTWLARWLAHNQRAEDALAEARSALRELHEAGDPWAIAWGELRMAQVLVILREDGAYPALRRAAQYAAASGDPLSVGIIADLEAFWREHERSAPEGVISLATTAKDFLLAAGSYAATMSAFTRLESAHERAGRLPEFVALVREQLDHLPSNTPEAVRAHLRYERGRALVEEGNRGAEAVADLTDAVTVLSSLNLDSTDHWYYLATACHVTSRYDEARHAANRIANRVLDKRAEGTLANPAWADACWLILADSYRNLGEHTTAIEHYAYLVSKAQEYGSGETHPVAVALKDMAMVLYGLDRDAEAAERFQQAAEVFAVLGNQVAAASCRCQQAQALFWSGDTEAALACLPVAEEAVAAVPVEPVAIRATCEAQLAETRARITVAAERPEAARDAARASAACRDAGELSAAIDMDILRAQVLLNEERPDLALPALDAARTACAEDDPRLEEIARLRTLARGTPDRVQEVQEVQEVQASGDGLGAG